MKETMMPILFHKTRVVLIDDNIRFLNTLKRAMESRGIECITFSTAESAIQFFNDNEASNPYLHFSTKDENDYLSSEKNIKINLNAIHQEMNKNDRKQDISVVVCDYQMPNITGDIILNSIPGNVKKIMLTGKADCETGINLLNNGIIENFITKNPLTMMEKLAQEIKSLQIKYFDDLLKPVSEFIKNNKFNDLHEPYNLTLRKIFFDLNISEYFTVNIDGTVVLKTEEGHVHYFSISTDDDMDSWLETAELSGASSSVINKLKSKEYTLILTNDEEANKVPSTWEDHLYPCIKQVHKGINYFSCIIKSEKQNRSSNTKVDRQCA